MKRNLYLKTTGVDEALEKYKKRLTELGVIKKDEKADLNEKCSELSQSNYVERITAEPVYAKCCSPLFNAAAMDGIAVISEDTKYATDGNPIRLKLNKNSHQENDSFSLDEKKNLHGTYIVVDTGDPIHSPYDAVIMAEDVTEITDDIVEITASVPGWSSVRPIGEDIVLGEMIIPSNHAIRPVDIGVMLASGNVEVSVKKEDGDIESVSTYEAIKYSFDDEIDGEEDENNRGNFGKSTEGLVKIGIIPTGTEIIKPYDEPKEGDIIDSNSGMFAALAIEAGGLPKRYDIVEDDYEKIKNRILEALDENDMVLVNAGSSAGTEDYTVHILRELGEVIVHGVSMKPGKPVILAAVKGKPVIGLPGYPVSAYLAFECFAKPVIKEMRNNSRLSLPEEAESTVKAVISKRVVSSLKHREYVRVKVGKVGDRYACAPLARGASAAMSLVRADGFMIIPQNSEGYEAGEEVEVKLFRSREEIEKTLVCIGSHDMLLDTINDMMAQKYGGLSLSSTHVGSLGGLMALSRGETVICPTHLLDENTGEYNIAYLRQIFGEGKVSLIKGVDRIQGIMVKKGNPLGINSISDLKKVLPNGEKPRFVNRQRGAGTRVLLDYKLKQEGLSPEDIYGYDKEASTHMAVAASVSGPDIDCGMGIKPAADAMGLDFIEIGPEEYDFAVKSENLDLDSVKAFYNILTSDEFKEKLAKIGGYSFSHTGEIIHI